MSIPLFPSFTYKRPLPAPFNTLGTDKKKRTDVKSMHRKALTQVSLHGPTLRAAIELISAKVESETKIAVGTKGDNIIVERVDSKGQIEVVVYNPNPDKSTDSTFLAGIFANPEDKSPQPYTLNDKGGKDGSALLLAVLATQDARIKPPSSPLDVEYEECMMTLEEIYISIGGGIAPDEEELSTLGARLCDNIYTRIQLVDSLVDVGIRANVSSNIRIITPLNINKGTYSPDEVIIGEFQVLKPSAGSTKKTAYKPVKNDELAGGYAFSERIYTPDEKMQIPSIESWFIVPKEVVRIAKHAKDTTSQSQPMRNFMLRGGAGVGKTESARAIASALNLPYLSLTCSANTEIFDLLGQILPDVEGIDGETGSVATAVKSGGKIAFMSALPTFQDIQMDAATAYQKLTGVYDEDVSEDIVYQKLVEVISTSAKKSVEEALPAGASSVPNNGQRFRYVETPLVRAMKHGYLIEIQEPSVIANPGVLVGLNSLLDNCKQITLPTGETIVRHPDTVVVVTTNNDYAGCRNINQSVISRMNLVLDIDEPTEKEMVSRVKAVTGCEDEEEIALMASVVREIQTRCRETMITDGVCGMRELVSWVQSYMITGDMAESARYSVLSSVSADAENREEINNTCIKPRVA